MSAKSRARIVEAMDKYSPVQLSNHLKRNATDDVVYFDRDSIVISDNDKAMFHYVLNSDYDAGYKNADFLTVYFEISNDKIIAGGYDLLAGDKTSKRIIVSNKDSILITTPYTYTKETIEELKNKIMNA